MAFFIKFYFGVWLMSEQYRALYRKWRPMTFDDVVGQRHITDTLRHEIAIGKIGHAYLFCGTRGTGKTTTAKIFSRAVNCENPNNGEPCNQCETCLGIAGGRILDVYEMDAASNNGVDNIRDLRDEVAYSPVGCKYKVYIIDEAHMLTTQAFNALLKTLEEPPEHALFILATTEPQKIPQTILSRCQRYDFKRIGTDDIAARLKRIAKAENINATEDAVELIAELGDGSLRDALSVLERCSSFGGEELRTSNVAEIVGIVDQTTLFDISDCVAEKNVSGAIGKLDGLLNMGKAVLNFFEECIEHFRSLLLCKECENPENILEKSSSVISKYKECAQKFTSTHLIYAITVLSEYHGRAKSMTTQNIAAEVALIKICNPSYSSDIDALCVRIEKLEQKLSGISGAAPIQKANAKAQSDAKKTADDAPPWDIESKSEPHIQTESSAASKSADINATVSQITEADNYNTEDLPSAAVGKVWELWPEALEAIKNNSKKLYMYLYKSKVEQNGDCIDIEVSLKNVYEKVATANGLEYLSNLFSETAGKPMRARVFMQGDRPGAEPRQEVSIMDIVKKKEQYGDIINIKGE